MAKGKGEIKGWITRGGVHIPIYDHYTVRSGHEPQDTKKTKVRYITKGKKTYLSNLPKEMQTETSKALDYIDETFPKAELPDIIVDEKRGPGERMHFDTFDNKLHIAKTELSKFNEHGDYNASTMVHEFAHALERRYVIGVKNYDGASIDSKRKAFIKEVSKRSGVKLTAAELRDLFGSYTTRDKNSEFVSMALERYYDISQHPNAQHGPKTDKRKAIGKALIETLNDYIKEDKK